MKNLSPSLPARHLRPRRRHTQGPGRAELAPAGVSGARRLPGAGEDPEREDLARSGDRRNQEIGPARPWRRGLSDRAQVELHAAQLPRPEIPGLQLRRGRAGHVQGSRYSALQPAHRDRGHGHRRLLDGHHRRLQLHPRRDLGGLRALRGSTAGGLRGRLSWARRSSARRSPSISTRITAGARTSAAKRPRCWSLSKARRGSRVSSLRSPPAMGCTASRPRSTTPRPSPRRRGSSSTVAMPSSPWAGPTTAAPRSSRYPDT